MPQNVNRDFNGVIHNFWGESSTSALRCASSKGRKSISNYALIALIVNLRSDQEIRWTTLSVLLYEIRQWLVAFGGCSGEGYSPGSVSETIQTFP